MRSQLPTLPVQVITAFEMQRKPAAFQRRALQEPVTVTSNGEPTLVVMSVDEYRRLRDQAEAATLPPDQTGRPAYPSVMRRTEAVSRLTEHRDDLAKLGITHVALFGSIARDQADEMSDVDVIVDTTDGRAPGLFALSRINEQLERILGRPVDVISRRGLDHAKKLKKRIAADMIDVF
jgi:prevent-host-death family protein